VVAATDYEGLDTPGVHPYLVGLSEGRGVLDAARVTRYFTRINSTTLIFGHSEGGQAALFAGELAPRYAILVVQGTADDLILPGLTDAFVEKACNAADTVDYDRYLGTDHSGVIPAAKTDVLNWFAARTAGVPIVLSSCQHGPTDRQTPTLPTPTQPTPTPQTPTSRLGTD
jgi:hypothetical protein